MLRFSSISASLSLLGTGERGKRNKAGVCMRARAFFPRLGGDCTGRVKKLQGTKVCITKKTALIYKIKLNKGWTMRNVGPGSSWCYWSGLSGGDTQMLKVNSNLPYLQTTLFRCCKLLLSIVWRGEESGLKEKEKHMMDVACLEPFLEAAPQVN